MALRKDDEREIKPESKKKLVGVFGATTVVTSFRSVIGNHVTPDHIFDATEERDFGGTGLRFAETSNTLGVSVVFFTTVGTDTIGSLVKKKLASVNIETVEFVLNQKTPHVAYLLTREDGMALGASVDEMNPGLSVDMLSKQIDRFKDLEELIIDTSYSEDIYTLLLSVLPPSLLVSIIISSLSSAKKIIPLLGRCDRLFGHVDQLNLLTNNLDNSPDGIADMLHDIANLGPKSVFAYDKKGVYALVDGQLYKAKASDVVKIVNTHAHEAFAAAIIACLRKGVSIERAIRFALQIDEHVKAGKQISALMLDDYVHDMKEKGQKKGLFNFSKPVPA